MPEWSKGTVCKTVKPPVQIRTSPPNKMPTLAVGFFISHNFGYSSLIMNITNARDSDAEIVKSLIRDCYIPQMYPSYRNLKDTLIAWIDGIPVGFGAFSLNEIHPHSKKTYVGVLPSFRRRGIGARIHAELVKRDSENFPLFVHCHTDQKAEKIFLEKLGYQVCARDYLLELDLSRIPKVPSSSPAKSYFELESSGFELQKISDFLIDRYIETHQWNPPCPRTDDIWKIARQMHPIDLHHSFALVEGDRVIAASDAYTNPSESREMLPLGWSDVGSPANLEAYKAMLIKQLRKISESGYLNSFLDLEASKASTEELLKWLPIKKNDVLTNYRLNIRK